MVVDGRAVCSSIRDTQLRRRARVSRGLRRDEFEDGEETCGYASSLGFDLLKDGNKESCNALPRLSVHRRAC